MSARRPVPLETTTDKIAAAIATAGGAGFFPWAPGTAGSLIAVPVLWFLRMNLDAPAEIAVWIVIFLIGWWASTHVVRRAGVPDHQSIVIDEVLGMAITCAAVSLTPLSLLVGFVAFRFFDIAKLFPVRSIDRWSKKQKTPIWQGFGVIFDDLLAGVQGFALLHLMSRYGHWF